MYFIQQMSPISVSGENESMLGEVQTPADNVKIWAQIRQDAFDIGVVRETLN
ncbi:hypothetical protein [Bacillus norwichensis]|uniref:Uncharacterized protein n=1 Tax=Bacillus norwichensis TaxID=2762217 RepID=A0ABR8VLW8_9BACI|nr:hypothetical protein [Bacillus norwichensis]MBD8005735.1 hypothetical protein [Bacillus norwichensis]